jgi:hypothetical protein
VGETWKPSDLFLRVQEFFSVIVPGSVGAWLASQLLRGSEWESQFRALSAAAQWAVFLVAALFLGFLLHPPAHVLNVVYDRTYRRWKRAKSDPLLQFARAEAEKRVPGISTSGSVYEWAKTRVESKDRNVAREVQFIQGISKMFRTEPRSPTLRRRNRAHICRCLACGRSVWHCTPARLPDLLRATVGRNQPRVPKADGYPRGNRCPIEDCALLIPTSAGILANPALQADGQLGRFAPSAARR